MTVLVLFDKLTHRYHVWDSDERESLAGCDEKMLWENLSDLPEEFYGREHSYTIDEVDFTLLRGM